jgi:flagellar hook-basal body complex protein FliE
VIPGIGAISSSLGPQALNAAATSPAGTGGGPAGGDGFANLLGSAIDQANNVQQNATDLALQGATGQASIADVTVAATEAQLSVQLITAVRDKAVDAINSIMSMTT